MKRIIFICIIISISNFCNSQNIIENNFKEKLSKISQIEITKEKQFKGQELYGHINGGSELYLEYGFKNLEYFEFILNEKEISASQKAQKYSLEIYEMGDDAQAYGIFSFNVHKFIRIDSLCAAEAKTKFVLQAASSKYYFSLIFEPQNSIQADEILKNLIVGLEDCQELLSIREKIKKEQNSQINSAQLKLVYGPIALSQIDPDLAEKYSNKPNFKLWIFNNQVIKEN